MTRTLAAVGLAFVVANPARPDGSRDVLSDAIDGATCQYFNRAAGGAWLRGGGDWRDADGRDYGDRAYAIAHVAETSARSVLRFDLTRLVHDWLGGRADASKGLLIRGIGSSRGIVVFDSGKAADRAARPALTIELANGGRRTLSPGADTFLDCTTEQSMGANAYLKASDELHPMLRFDLPADLDAASVASAMLALRVQRVYGAADFGVFAVNPPGSPDSAARDGLAAGYVADEGIDKAPGVLFATGFESLGWRLRWSGSGLGDHAEAVDSDPPLRFVPLSGRALRVTIPRGGRSALDLRYDFREHTGSEPEEAYFRYYLRFADDWAPTVDGGKLPGFAGTYSRAGWGMRRSTGSDGWSMRGSFSVRPSAANPYSGTTPIGTYAYHADIREPSGETWYWPLGRLAALENNRWYCIEQYVKLNDIGKRDGVLRAWIDGRLAFERTDIRMRDVAGLRIESVWFNVYHGGTQPSFRDMHLYIDNVVIATRYIGPMGIAADGRGADTRSER